MKILFFTPIKVASAIGRVSKLIVEQLLLLGHEVVVIRSEDSAEFGGATHPFSCEIVNWNERKRVERLAAQSELVIYQIGNHYPYHRGCLEWLPVAPGVISLHDNFLGHLFWSWSERMGRDKANAVLSGIYGEKTAQSFFNHSSAEAFLEFASQFAPMTEWIAAMGTAVIVHSSWAMERIARSCRGPSEVVALPYDAPYLERTEPKALIEESDRLIVLTIGHVNPNKRYSSIIKAIGESALLRDRVSFRIVGPAESHTIQELTALAGQLGVQLTMTGPVGDEELATEIQNADIMCCLRWPALEAASASTIEAMLFGKAVIVTDTGFYRDLPSDSVMKVIPEREIPDLRTCLEGLVEGREIRVALGEVARNYAAKTFRADTYAAAIVQMNHRILQSHVVAGAARQVVSTLVRWGSRGDVAVGKAITGPLALIR